MEKWNENKKKHDALLKEWGKSYESDIIVDPENIEFTCDGPSDWEKYFKQKPKILFLLKEATGGWWQPCDPNKVYKGTFSQNIARWRNFINGSSVNFQSKEE